MQLSLTDDQKAEARRLRALGTSYPDIHAKLGLGDDIRPFSLRYHCSDINVPEAPVRKAAVGSIEASDGRTIRYFTEAEDQRIIAWALSPKDTRVALFALANEMDRRRHSLAARIRTLQRQGKIPADVANQEEK